MIIPQGNDSVKLCCNGKGCPQIRKISDTIYEIVDDFGKTVRISKDELKLIPDAVNLLDDRALICG